MRRRVFALEDSQLVERTNEDLGRLGISVIEGTTWRLAEWAPGEPAAEDIEISLVFEDHRIAGHSGCNRYQGAVTTGKLPGDFSITGPLAATMMACPPPIEDVEARYFAALQQASRFRFAAGRLMIDWGGGENWGALAFVAEN
jgi:putative lipoprotein